MKSQDMIDDRPTSSNYQNDRVTYVIPQKNAGIGIVLSFIFVGLGHLYAEQIGKGLLLMIIYFVLLFFSMVLILFEPLLYFLGLGTALLFWVWAMYDVNKVIKAYNEHILLTGRPPV